MRLELHDAHHALIRLRGYECRPVVIGRCRRRVLEFADAGLERVVEVLTWVKNRYPEGSATHTVLHKVHFAVEWNMQCALDYCKVCGGLEFASRCFCSEMNSICDACLLGVVARANAGRQIDRTLTVSMLLRLMGLVPGDEFRQRLTESSDPPSIEGGELVDFIDFLRSAGTCETRNRWLTAIAPLSRLSIFEKMHSRAEWLSQSSHSEEDP